MEGMYSSMHWNWGRQWCASQHAMVQGCLPRGVCFREVFLPSGVLEVCLPRGCVPGGCLGRRLCLPRGPAMNDLPRGCPSTGVSSGGYPPKEGSAQWGCLYREYIPRPRGRHPPTQRQTAPEITIEAGSTSYWNAFLLNLSVCRAWAYSAIQKNNSKFWKFVH